MVTKRDDNDRKIGRQSFAKKITSLKKIKIQLRQVLSFCTSFDRLNNFSMSVTSWHASVSHVHTLLR